MSANDAYGVSQLQRSEATEPSLYTLGQDQFYEVIEETEDNVEEYEDMQSVLDNGADLPCAGMSKDYNNTHCIEIAPNEEEPFHLRKNSEVTEDNVDEYEDIQSVLDNSADLPCAAMSEYYDNTHCIEMAPNEEEHSQFQENSQLDYKNVGLEMHRMDDFIMNSKWLQHRYEE